MIKQENYNPMKHILLLACTLFVFGSCTEKTLAPVVTDDIPPGEVTNAVVENIPGGANIKFLIPEDTDLAYVRATFLRNGVERDTRSSLYTNQLSIEGLSDVTPQDVKLYSVDRSENVSNPVSVTIEPMTPSYLTIYESLKITPDFGGARFTWDNEDETPIFINLLADDTTSTLKSREIHYTSQVIGDRSLRGFASEPIKFAAIVGDRYDNYSDTIIETITPLFEEKFDKTEWRIVPLANDHDWNAWGFDDENIYDDNTESYAHTWGGTGWPQMFTIDLGGLKKFSRMKLWQRLSSDGFYYAHGNPKTWEVYGRADEPEMDGSWDNWTLINECSMVKPSGLPMGSVTNEDIDAAHDGHEFTFDVDTTPEVRYIRIKITATWDGATYCNFAEMSVFGQSQGAN